MKASGSEIMLALAALASSPKNPVCDCKEKQGFIEKRRKKQVLTNRQRHIRRR